MYDINVLIACECSGRVRNAFRELGFNAWSCDLLSSEDRSDYHIQGDVNYYLNGVVDKRQDHEKFLFWDLMIAHPPCTYLATSGNRWMYDPRDKDLPIEHKRPHPKFPDRATDRDDAVNFFLKLAYAPIPYIAIENPAGIMSTIFRKPDQYIQPYEFGHPVSKRTGLWLKNLPLLRPHNIVEPEWIYFRNGKRMNKWYHECAHLPKGEREKERSRTFMGIAKAMANQWGSYILNMKMKNGVD